MGTNRVKENIRFLRRKAGFTQQALADRLNIKRSLLGAYEEGRAEVRLPVLQQMAALFGISINDLTSKDLTQGAPTDSRVRPSAPANGSGIPPAIFPTEPAPTRPAPVEAPAPAPPPVALPPAQRDSDRHAGIKLRTLTLTTDKHGQPDITLVPREELGTYTQRYSDPDYLATLPVMCLPQLDKSQYFRAFAFDGNAVLPHIPPGSTAVCRYVRNWYELNDSQLYALVSKTLGILFTPIISRLSNRGEILFATHSAVPDRPLPAADILEVWEVNCWLLAANGLEKPLTPGLERTLAEIRQELQGLKSRLGHPTL